MNKSLACFWISKVKRIPRPYQASDTDKLKQNTDRKWVTEFRESPASKVNAKKWPPEGFRTSPNPVEHEVHHHADRNANPSSPNKTTLLRCQHQNAQQRDRRKERMQHTRPSEDNLTDRKYRAEHHESIIECWASKYPPNENEADSGEPENHRTSNLPQSGQYASSSAGSRFITSTSAAAIEI